MFTGFSDETVDFLWGIRFNNERSWFEPRKELYQRCLLKPMRELCDELYGFLHEKRPDYDLFGRVSRIYRDARRLHGRGPYKDHLWLSVERPGDLWDPRPMFWFEIHPDTWSYGLGYWRVEPVTMQKLRLRMDRNPKPMEALTRKLNRQREFSVWAEEYKRPKGPAPSAVLEPWYRWKRFSLQHEEKLTEEVFSHDLVDHLERGYAFLLPFYDYFSTLDADPDPRENRT